MSKKKDKGINSELEVAIAQLLRDVMSDPTATITDKVNEKEAKRFELIPNIIKLHNWH